VRFERRRGLPRLALSSKDGKKRTAWYERACMLGALDGCALSAEEDVDLERAFNLAQTGCDGEHRRAACSRRG